MRTMLAARYLAPNRIQAVELGAPSIMEGEALVQVEACGICGSDLSVVMGKHPRARPPLTLGHELCGQVVDIQGGEEGGVRVGDRVTLYPLISCGSCYVCRHGSPHACRELRLYGFDFDGGMAELVKLPVRSLLKVPHSLPASVGALLEPLAVGVHAVSRAPVCPNDTVAILGGGTIGMVTAMAARILGVSKIFVTDVVTARIELARELGFEAFSASDPRLQPAILEATNGEGADVVFECTGSPKAALQMTTLARCRGSIVNAGVFANPPEVDLRSLNFKELTLIGSRVYSGRTSDVGLRSHPLFPSRN